MICTKKTNRAPDRSFVCFSFSFSSIIEIDTYNSISSNLFFSIEKQTMKEKTSFLKHEKQLKMRKRM